MLLTIGIKQMQTVLNTIVCLLTFRLLQEETRYLYISDCNEQVTHRFKLIVLSSYLELLSFDTKSTVAIVQTRSRVLRALFYFN